MSSGGRPPANCLPVLDHPSVAPGAGLRSAPKSVASVRFLTDFGVQDMANVWLDTQMGAFTDDKVYVVQTNTKVIERCLVMATDPGDLVLDPTCGWGTTSITGQAKEAEIARTAPSTAATLGDIRQGFVYERVPHVTLKSITNNAEIDVI